MSTTEKVHSSKSVGPEEELAHEEHELSTTGKFLQRWFSPYRQSRRPAIVFYCVWEFGAKVGNLAFNFSNPLLVNTLGNDKFRDIAGAGAIIYSYLSVVTSIITALSFLTFTSVMEYETLKRKALVRFGYVCAAGLVCFGFCFPEAGGIYLASLLSVGCKVTQSISSLANDALLDAVANEVDPYVSHKSDPSQRLDQSHNPRNGPEAADQLAETILPVPISTPPRPVQLTNSLSQGRVNVHQINARAYVTGYLGMVAFLILLAPILAIAYFPGKLKDLFWVQGIIPIVLIGLWYLYFIAQVDINMPKQLGRGPPIPTLEEAQSIVKAERSSSVLSRSSSRSKEGGASVFGSLNLGSSAGSNQRENLTRVSGAIGVSQTSGEFAVTLDGSLQEGSLASKLHAPGTMHTHAQTPSLASESPREGSTTPPPSPPSTSPSSSALGSKKRLESGNNNIAPVSTTVIASEANFSLPQLSSSYPSRSEGSDNDTTPLAPPRPSSSDLPAQTSSADHEYDSSSKSISEVSSKSKRRSSISPLLRNKGPRLSMPQLLLFGLQRGSAMQWNTILSLRRLPDLSKFMASWVFCSGAANTAYTVGAIIAYDINIGSQNPVYYIIAGVFVGIFSAIFGLVVFRAIISHTNMTPKYVLAFNLIVVALVFVYVLFVETAADFFAIAFIAGSQIGCLGSLSKSIVSKLVPTKRQSRLFSLYQFSQEATGWIGPLIVASVQTAIGGGKKAFRQSVVEVCLVEIAIGLPLLLWVDMDQGEKIRDQIDKEMAEQDEEELSDPYVTRASGSNKA